MVDPGSEGPWMSWLVNGGVLTLLMVACVLGHKRGQRQFAEVRRRTVRLAAPYSRDVPVTRVRSQPTVWSDSDPRRFAGAVRITRRWY